MVTERFTDDNRRYPLVGADLHADWLRLRVWLGTIPMGVS